jgi:putative MFS transporter
VRLRANGIVNMLGRAATVVSPLIVVALFTSSGVARVVGLMIGLLIVQIMVVALWGIEPARHRSRPWRRRDSRSTHPSRPAQSTLVPRLA